MKGLTGMGCETHILRRGNDSRRITVVPAEKRAFTEHVARSQVGSALVFTCRRGLREGSEATVVR